MPGHLFIEYFLTEAIRPTSDWRVSVVSAPTFDAFRSGVRQRYNALGGSRDPNEAVTEQELIRPVLELLGWADYLPQQGAARNEDIPDLLLPNTGPKDRAVVRGSTEEGFRDAIVVEESKRFGLLLDARDTDGERRSRTQHGQILRYLSTLEIESASRMRWGILTSGGMWRLYDYRARPRAAGYFEADLGMLSFHLYDLRRDDVDYVLRPSPIVLCEEKAAFGSYRTRDLILTYVNALCAGGTDTVVSAYYSTVGAV